MSDVDDARVARALEAWFTESRAGWGFARCMRAALAAADAADQRSRYRPECEARGRAAADAAGADRYAEGYRAGTEDARAMAADALAGMQAQLAERDALLAQREGDAAGADPASGEAVNPFKLPRFVIERDGGPELHIVGRYVVGGRDTIFLSAPAAPAVPHTYASTQATTCAGCGEYKHTPLRIDAMGGYVCLTCIDKKLGGLLGEFGYEQEAPAVPEGYALVPVEPTDAMLDATYDGQHASDIWRDMLAAFDAQQSARCDCGKKLASECEPWEPGCDLGKSAEHVRAVRLPQQAAPSDQPANGEREAFETAMRNEFVGPWMLDRRGDKYSFPATRAAWAAWQARAALAQQPAALVGLTPEAIDLIAADGMRSATGGIYATQVYGFAEAVIAEFCRINGIPKPQQERT